MNKKFERLEALDEPMHNKMMDLFRKFLLLGGLPDASKYDAEKKLKIRRVYDLIPSNMENKKKRVVAT